MKFWVLAIAALLAAGISLNACTSQPRDPGRPAQTFGARDLTLDVAGQDVRVHLQTPSGSPPWKTVMLLHGARGPGAGTMLNPVADALVARGFAAATVSYFDALPDDIANKGAVRLFPTRTRHLNEIVDGLLERPEVMGPKIGVYGYSLGGFHALELAATNDNVAAVAALAAGLPRNVPAREVSDAAPALFLHGTEDRVVAPSRTKDAAAVWRRHGRMARVVWLDGERHAPGAEARSRVARDTAGFMAETMKERVVATGR